MREHCLSGAEQKAAETRVEFWESAWGVAKEQWSNTAERTEKVCKALSRQKKHERFNEIVPRLAQAVQRKNTATLRACRASLRRAVLTASFDLEQQPGEAGRIG